MRNNLTETSVDEETLNHICWKLCTTRLTDVLKPTELALTQFIKTRNTKSQKCEHFTVLKLYTDNELADDFDESRPIVIRTMLHPCAAPRLDDPIRLLVYWPDEDYIGVLS